eukprot:3350013-Prymnesium_polylepis.1
MSIMRPQTPGKRRISESSASALCFSRSLSRCSALDDLIASRTCRAAGGPRVKGEPHGEARGECRRTARRGEAGSPGG